jgi:hypothetical protein
VEDVAGYRVLRTAGHGDRAVLLVGFDEGETVVLKVTGRDDAAVPREVEALQRAAGDHVVGLRDVESDARQVVLVLDRSSQGTLAELLERRASLEPGEAVTMLAPLATTIARLHASGIAHGAVSPASVCFDDDGSPTLVGFGSAELFAPGAPEVVLDGIGGVDADRRALGALVESVLARVGGVARRQVDVSDAAPAALAAALFEWATPAPIRFEADTGDAVVVRPTAVAIETELDESTSPGLPHWLTAVVPETVLERIEEPVAKISAIWNGWSTRRRRLVLGGAAGALATLVLVAALPAPAPSAATGSTSPVPATTASGQPVAGPELPDDPVSAADLLLETRAECFRQLSLLCLDAVVQPNSAAAAHDLALMRDLHAGGEYSGAEVLPGEPVLVERLGDSALLDLPPGSSPASVLILRTTEGWRLRQYFEAAPSPDGGPDSDATPDGA